VRPLRLLPKANLHLHLTGSLRLATLRELAVRHGVTLPAALWRDGVSWWRRGTVPGWPAFQELYERARAVIVEPDDVRRIVREAAEADAACGARWIELQFDPRSYAPSLGNGRIEPAIECVLDAARAAERLTGVGVGIIVSASWARLAGEAEATARAAVRYADAGVVGFGLSNDERSGTTEAFQLACRTAAGGGLLCVPHGGFYAGADHVRRCVEQLGADRIGHGLTAASDPAVIDLLAARDVTLEVCPTSYEPFGVVVDRSAIPLRALRSAGVPVALATDDPLLFGCDLVDQYAIARDELGLSDPELAHLARQSFTASRAPRALVEQALTDIDAWQRD
jgi:adenosine deaminase